MQLKLIYISANINNIYIFLVILLCIARTLLMSVSKTKTDDKKSMEYLRNQPSKYTKIYDLLNRHQSGWYPV